MEAAQFADAAKLFVLDTQFYHLFISTIVLFSASLVSWYFYSRHLAIRDLFDIPKIKDNSKLGNFINRVGYFLKYLLIFPFYSFIWFLIFSYLLFLLSRTRPIGDILFFGVVVVASIRIGAYVSEKLAEDMAKLLPWSLILIFLIDPAAITIEGIVSSFKIFIQYIPSFLKYLLFIIVVEWMLRIGVWLIRPREVKLPK